MRTILDWVKIFWRTLTRPAVHLSLGFLTIGGFVAGGLFWGGFNTVFQASTKSDE